MRRLPEPAEIDDMIYSHNEYGDIFADVYDDWYHDLDDIDACVSALIELAERGTVLELGVGTGRIAVPLAIRGADAGIDVVGIDSSPLMLEQLLAKAPPSAPIWAVLGHMVRDMPSGPFALILIAYNTLFNLLSAGEQRECLGAAAMRLAPGGHIVVDCFVPNNELPNYIEPFQQRTTPEGVVLSEATVDTAQQRIDGVFTEVRNDGSKTTRNWQVRYSGIEEIDAMADAAGLKCEQRWSDYEQHPFTKSSSRHISVYGRAPLTNR